MSLGDDRPAQDRTAQLRALAHPVRLRILSLLTVTAMTAAEIARELDLTHANASYHLRQLLAAGTIEVAGEERIRGGAAKRYRYDVERDLARPERPLDGDAEPTGDAQPTGEDRLLYAALAAELRRRSERRLRGPGNYLTDAEFWVDPGDWREITDQMAAASARLHRTARAPRTPGTIRVSVTVALFRMAE